MRLLTYLFVPILLLLLSADLTAQSQFGCGSFPHGTGLRPGERGLVDRFNRVWHAPPHLVAYQKHRGRSVQSADCGGFRLDFEDVILRTGIGFDDPTPIQHPVLGTTTLGMVRQRTVCEVFNYIGSLIDVRGAPDVLIKKTLMRGDGMLGAASPYFLNLASPYIGGTMYDHINTGVDPTPDPGNYDAFIVFDLSYPKWNSDWNQPSGSRYDLFSVTLHEITHTLGFMSLIGSDGRSEIGGAWSLFDRRLRDGSGTLLIDPVSNTLTAPLSALFSNSLLFRNIRCDGGGGSPVYSPPFYEPGSSFSHFDRVRGGIPYVMNPSTAGGDDRRYTEPEIETLCDLGYTLKGGLCGNCAPLGKEDYGTTPSGVEICIDVLANDSDPDNTGPLAIDPSSPVIESGGGMVRINGTQLCYTPLADYSGVARLRYAPTDGARTGPDVAVTINVSGAAAWPPTGRRDAFIWYFGNKAGIAFTTGVPVPLLDGELSNLEGSATVCHPRDGHLLFYTNGTSVWNARHKVMRNGTGLMGHWTSSQSALIVPHPGDTAIFYIFTTNSLSEPDKTVRYSIVDMAQDSGRGEVTSKNNPLFAKGTEKIGATRHCNGIDYWIIAHEWGSNRFYSYHLSSDSLSSVPVISDVGNVVPGTGDVQGSIQISPSGRQMAVSTSGAHTLELFDFDPATGVVSNPRELARGMNYYGVEFSPDNSKLYTVPLPSPGSPAPLMQYDLQAGDLAAIKASAVELHRERDDWDGAQLQMGPDGKIYVAYYGRGVLGVITKPNVAGTAAGYVHDGLSLSGRGTSYGIVNMIDCDMYGAAIGFANSTAHVTSSTSSPHIGDTLRFRVDICNWSQFDRTNLEVEAVLPEGVVYIDGMSNYPRQQFPLLRAGTCDSFFVRGVVDPHIRFNASLTLCTHILDSSIGPCRATVDDCSAFTVAATDVAVLKSVDRTVAVTGDTLLYSVVVLNQGPATGSTLVVRDPLPSEVRYLSHTSTGGAAFNPVAGTYTIPEIAVGSSDTLQIRTVVVSTLRDTAVNCAELESMDQTDLDLRNNRSCVETQIGGDPDIAVLKTLPRTLANQGDTLEYTILVVNNGPVGTTNIVVRDLLPAGLVYRGHTLLSPSTFDPVTGILRIPNLLNGGSVALRLRAQLSAAGGSRLTNCVDLISLDGSDRDTTNNRSCASVLVDSCITPQMLGVRMESHHIYESGRPFSAPVTLISAPGIPLTHLLLTLEYDSTVALPDIGSDFSQLLRGTLLEGWTVVGVAVERGRISVEVRAPAGEALTDAGLLLHFPLRLYMGEEGEAETPLHPVVRSLGSECVTFSGQDGIARLDSICGLNLRMIEAVPGGKYALHDPRPHPATDRLDMVFELGLDGETVIDILDLNGSVVATPIHRYLAPGRYEMVWETQTLPSGRYIVRMRSGDWGTSRAVVVQQ